MKIRKGIRVEGLCRFSFVNKLLLHSQNSTAWYRPLPASPISPPSSISFFRLLPSDAFIFFTCLRFADTTVHESTPRRSLLHETTVSHSPSLVKSAAASIQPSILCPLHAPLTTSPTFLLFQAVSPSSHLRFNLPAPINRPSTPHSDFILSIDLSVHRSLSAPLQFPRCSSSSLFFFRLLMKIAFLLINWYACCCWGMKMMKHDDNKC